MKKIFIAVIISVILGSVLIPAIPVLAENIKCEEIIGSISTSIADDSLQCVSGQRKEACCPKEGLVVCGTPCCRCRLCDFFILIDHLIDFAIFKIAPIAAVLLIIIGGVMFLISSGNPSTIIRARKIIVSVIIGLAIIYSSYMIIGLILKSVGLAGWTSEMYGSWINNGVFEIDCGGGNSDTSGGSGSGGDTDTGDSGSGGDTDTGDSGSGGDTDTDFCRGFTNEQKKSCDIYTRNKMSWCASNPCGANNDSTGRCYPQLQGSIWRCIDVN